MKKLSNNWARNPESRARLQEKIKEQQNQRFMQQTAGNLKFYPEFSTPYQGSSQYRQTQ
jgi:hypothetical protein